MVTLIEQVTSTKVEEALHRVECGMSGVEDANLIRARLLELESQLRVYRLGDDAETDHPEVD